MERLSRAEMTVIAAALLLTAGLILYHAFDAQPLTPVVETFAASLPMDVLPPSSGSAQPTSAQVQQREDMQAQTRSTTAQKPAQSVAAAEKHVGPINLNTASKEELMELDGIGEVKAEAILTYRLENGAFQSVDELLEVPGIGEKTLAKLRDQVCI